MTTVGICDIEPVAIEGLRALLETEGLRVVGAENTLSEGMDVVRQLRPSLLIVDKAFGTDAVTDWMGAVRHLQPDVAIIVWSSALTEVDAVRLLQGGAKGVVRKTSPLNDLLACIRTVAAGGTWLADDIISDTVRHARFVRSPLTLREGQVMDLIELGMKNKEIGDKLGIRTGTVKIHLKHIFEKTGIRGRYGLALSGLKEKGYLAPNGEVSSRNAPGD